MKIFTILLMMTKLIKNITSDFINTNENEKLKLVKKFLFGKNLTKRISEQV